MTQQAIHAVVGHPLEQVRQIDPVPLLGTEVGDGVYRRRGRRPLVTTAPHEEITAGATGQDVVALTAPQHIISHAAQEAIIAGGAEQPVPLIRAQQIVAALAVDGDGLRGRAQGAATQAGFGTQGEGMIPRRQILEVDGHGLVHRQQPVVAIRVADALAVLVHHLGAAKVLDPHRQLARGRIDHAGAEVERHPGPLQRKDIVGADPQLGIVRLGRHLDGNLGAVGQDATGTGIALIRGGDAQVVQTPEVPGWLVV